MTSTRWLSALSLGAALLAAAPVVLAQSAPGDAQAGAATAPAASHSAGEAAQGRRLYSQLCSHCHGIRMVNPGTSSFDLRKFPHDDKARFLNSVTKGKNTMPAWGDMLKPEEIEHLWAYILTGGHS
ncbi:c-type cytochrome [Paracraurococcus lichenis]|uniref:Cytochrome c n=1 Tax=Paracraurococcus lichenis TaxID=3064888 RepID=A0ABT9DZ95_9PROT|nr:cytochrome c [Paracraurococcus sp. LOR1-02]MDO9709203.1 cytochrome c [Paracraurococcus sp. LOR1-02]